MAARPPVTDADTPCAQASVLLSTKCRAFSGASPEFCDSWLAYAESQCSGQPCERQLCYWMGQCLAGRCVANPSGSAVAAFPTQFYGSDHVCSFLATTKDNEPYLAYRVGSQCPLQFQGAPLFEDISVPSGSGEEVIATLAGSKGLFGPSLG